MSKYLLDTVERFRFETEEEADNFLIEQKKEFSINKSTLTRKYNKKTDEEYFVLSITKAFTEEKDPIEQYEITYSNGAF